MKVSVSINAKPAGHICNSARTPLPASGYGVLAFCRPRWSIDSQWANAHYSLQCVRTRLRERL